MSGDIVAAVDNGVPPRPAEDNVRDSIKGEVRSQTSEAPPSGAASTPPPRPADLQIRLNDDPALGFCVYVLRPYRRGERLFEERTALEATHDAHRDGVRNVYERYCQQSAERRRALHGSFPHLAWANGVDAREAAEARNLVGSLLTPTSKNLVIDNRLTAADHMRMRPDWGIDEHSVPVMPPTKPASRAKAALFGLFHKRAQQESSAGSVEDEAERRARAETLDWFSRYAFRLKPEASFVKPGGNHQAAVYLLTDLINHRCGGFQNCRVSADVGTIAVLALRDIAAGEEVTINYSKDVKDFQCKGECCVKK
ncbi:hypothetical protein SEUCBS140593_004896 [Sporothrix eucalyptigena]|uniref:SET domain-containing protein n=1 Tax=Sporothrix eucalyptigena TaxID=1812306 RepID=A0ABP0BS51_9PEZI